MGERKGSVWWDHHAPGAMENKLAGQYMAGSGYPRGKKYPVLVTGVEKLLLAQAFGPDKDQTCYAHGKQIHGAGGGDQTLQGFCLAGFGAISRRRVNPVIACLARRPPCGISRRRAVVWCWKRSRRARPVTAPSARSRPMRA